MKTKYAIILFISFGVTLFSVCSKENNNNDFNPDNLVLNHSIKGWELYSWENSNGWHYSLIAGTNSSKTFEQVIQNNIVVTGETSFKKVLDKLPQGEEIVWIGEEWVKNCWISNNNDCFKLPPQNIINVISDYCHVKNLKLNITK
jgi:hypothetical protein